MTNEQIKASLKLFKSYLPNCTEELDVCKDVNEFKENMLKKGLIFVTKETENIPSLVVEEALQLYGVKEEEWNQTFHKSFATVRDTDIETLVIQQIVHYITTYGFETLGIYDKDTVYIPKEELNIPELDRDIPLVIIKEITENELQEKLMTLLTSGIALKEETVKDVLTLSDYLPKVRFDEIKNKEIKITLYDKYNVVPRNNVEFLRYLIYKLTKSTLLINNTETIKALKEANIKDVAKLLKSYITVNGDTKLAQIFLRYKELFLALKRNKDEVEEDKESILLAQYVNSVINRVSKLSKKYHTPLQPKILDSLTQTTFNNLLGREEEIENELNNVTVFRELRILNGLNYRMSNPESMLYKVRNGKGFVKEGKSYNSNVLHINTYRYIYNIVVTHLVNRLKDKLKDKTFYIPENINYTLPTSEKQFIENIPEGSYIEVPRGENMVVGVHWKNVQAKELYSGRVDLDLHAQNKDEQFGWNTSYRSTGSQEFYYSGDQTDASGEHGATEVFFIGKGLENKAFLLTLNKYSSPRDCDIPYEFFIAETDKDQVNSNYTVNPNNVKFVTQDKFKWQQSTSMFDTNQKTLGFVVVTSEYIRIYFKDYSLGQSIVTRQTKVIQDVFKCLQLQTETQLCLKDLLVQCGAKLVNSPTYDEFIEDVEMRAKTGEPVYKKITHKVDYDLSLENLDKTTFIDLLQ